MEQSNNQELENQIKNQLNNINSKVILFDTFHFENSDDVDYFINSLTSEDSNNCILQAVVSAYKRGAFTITESEVLSKSLRLLSK